MRENNKIRQYLTHARLRTKLIAGMSMLMVILLFSGTYSILSSQKLQNGYEAIITHDQAILLSLQSVQMLLAQLSGEEKSFLLNGDSAKFMYHGDIRSSKKDKEVKLQHEFALLEDNISDEKDQRILEQVKSKYTIYSHVSNEVANLYLKNDREGAIKSQLEEMSAINDLVPIITGFSKQKEKKANENIDVLNKQNKKTKSLLLVISTFSIFIATLTSLFMVRSIGPLSAVNSQLKEIASGEGDLSREIFVKSNDEIGLMTQSFNMMMSNLRSIVGQSLQTANHVSVYSEDLLNISHQVTESTKHISIEMERLASSSLNQMSSVEKTAASMEIMSQRVVYISTISKEMEQLASNAAELSNLGVAAILSILHTMEEIDDVVGTTGVIVKQLDQRSAEIEKMVASITGIAQQTNILAINASIEAARANNGGKGFQVIASEVRKLASLTRDFANKITFQVTSARKDTSDAVRIIKTGTEKVAKGLMDTEQVNETFQHIQKSYGQVTLRMHHIYSAVEQLEKDEEGISLAMHEMRCEAREVMNSSQQTSATSEELFAAMEEVTASAHLLTKESGHLMIMLQKFKI